MIRPLLPSIRNTPYGKRIQSKLAREDSSFGHPSLGYGPTGGGGGGRGGGGGGGGRGGGNFQPGYQRHLGRPQLQHINALTDVYGSQGGPFGAGGLSQQSPYGGGGGGGGYMQQQHTPMQSHFANGAHPGGFRQGPPGGSGNGGSQTPAPMQSDHTGLSYHAPGPDGAQWLHLRAGGSAGNGGGGGGAAAAPWGDMNGGGLGGGEMDGGWPQYGFDPHGLGQNGMGQHQMM